MIIPSLTLPNNGVLVASASPNLRRRFISEVSTGMAFEATGGADALQQIETGNWQVVFLDRHLPDLDAAEVASLIRRRLPNTRVMLLHTGGNPTPIAHSQQNCRNNGASRATEVTVDSLSAHRSLSRIPAKPLPGMIGQSEAMLRVYRMARLVAPRNATVLITGQTGTGKELVAHAIHQLSPRSTHRFVVVNCAAIPESLLESELFGYTRGAFTGAVQSQIGRFQAAQGGTLFLDEVSELPLSLQPKLLRFLETRELQRLGSPEAVQVDVRVVAASNADLESRVADGQFREDLFYRLSAFGIELPPLRDRADDILPLARYFLRQLSAAIEITQPELTPAAIQLLQAHSWKGNVRELRLVLEQACILADGCTEIGPEYLRFVRNRRAPTLVGARMAGD